MEKIKTSGEFDLIGMAVKVLREWKLMMRFAFVGGVCGVVVALSLPKYWTSEVELAPEFSSGGLSGLSGGLADIASSFGVDLGSGGSMDAIYPDLYPNVLSSTDFIVNLFDVPVRSSDNPELRPYLYHVSKESKIPFWGYPLKWFSEFKEKMFPPETGSGEVDPFLISRRDWRSIDVLRKCILCSVDRKSSVISIAVIDQDPIVAAIVADTVKNRLQTYITEYRTNKIRLDVNFYREQTEIAKDEYEQARRAYGEFADSNVGLARASRRGLLEDLESDMEMKQSIYRQSMTMLKQSEARLQERTPSFSVLQRPVTPFKASNLPKLVVCILWCIFFCFIGASWILFFRDAKIKNLFKE